MKPFLILQLRPNDDDANGELAAIKEYGNLTDDDVHTVRMEKTGIPEINLDDYSAVIIGGGPSNASDPIEKKSEEEITFEKQLIPIFDKIIERDFPFLGICYGLNIIAVHQDGHVSKDKYTENVGAVDITITDEGKTDPLTKNLPPKFRTFVGHKEACQNLPKGAVLLASSDTCPVQMIRLKNNVYACQFHPELDVKGIIVRINVHKHGGYFPPEDAESLIEEIKHEEIIFPHKILARFVKKYQI